MPELFSTPEFTILKAARLIDGNGGPVAEQAAIMLHGDTISRIGTHETVQAPEGAAVREVDYGDATILPGLVDSHVHLIGIGDGRAGDELVTLPDEVLTVQAAQNVRRHLYSGVTTVRDCGAKNRTDLPAAGRGRYGHRAVAAAGALRQGQWRS